MTDELFVLEYDEADSAAIVVLERIEPGVEPVYCVHGRTTCIGCDEWVWLGHETVNIVREKIARPLCIDCARRELPNRAPDRHVSDHLRKDGPHD